MTVKPTDTEVRAALARILSSPSFVHARRAQQFLRFVVEETLAGRAGAISGRAIAVRVFGKPAGFDSANDPLVRVEAGRVRTRLREYYVTAGAGDSVRIVIEPGSYVPSFAHATAPQPPVELRWRAMWPLRSATAALVIVILSLTGSALLPFVGEGDRQAADGTVMPKMSLRVLVRPFQGAGDEETRYLALGMTDEIMVRLGAYPDLQLFVAPSNYLEETAASGVPDDEPRADYVLAGSVRSSAKTLRVLPQLIDVRSGEQVWTADYEEPLGVAGVWSMVSSISGAVARAIGEPYGPLFDREVARAARASPDDVDPYHCTLRFVFALQVISEGAHGRATDCFERVVAAEPDSSLSWARLAALYRMEYLHDFNRKTNSEPPLDRAAEAVQRALGLDANNVFAQQELAFLCLLRDDRAGFEESVARVLAMNPSADISAALGINFVKMGEVERGFALIGQGMAESPRAPPFFFLGYTVNALRMHDYAAAFRWAERMATPDWPLSQAMLAATAALAGHEDRAHAAAERLLELRPSFATTGRSVIARGRLGPDVEALLAEGLALVGVTLA